MSPSGRDAERFITSGFALVDVAARRTLRAIPEAAGMASSRSIPSVTTERPCRICTRPRRGAGAGRTTTTPSAGTAPAGRSWRQWFRRTDDRYCRCPPAIAVLHDIETAAPLPTRATQQPPTVQYGYLKKWQWAVLVGLDVVGKLLPTATLRDWVKMRFQPIAKEHRVIYRSLQQLPNPDVAYRWLRQSYSPMEAFTHLCRCIALKRPLCPGQPWDVSPESVRSWIADGHSPVALLHRVAVVGEQIGARRQDPLERVRMMILATADATPPVPMTAAMDEAFLATAAHETFLHAQGQRALGQLLSLVLQEGARALRQAPPGGTIQVQVGPYALTFTQETTLDGTALPHGPLTDQLRGIAAKLRVGRPLTSIESAIVRTIWVQNPDLPHLLQRQLAPIEEAESARHRALRMIGTAALLPDLPLETLLRRAGGGGDDPVAVELPRSPRLSITAETARPGRASAWRADLPATYYLGPYSYARGQIVQATGTGEARRRSALLVRDRRGHTFHVTEFDLVHLERLMTAMQQTAGLPSPLGVAFRSLVEGLWAAWLAARLPLRRPAGVSPAVMTHANAIARTNWAVALIHAIDQVWEDAIAVRALSAIALATAAPAHPRAICRAAIRRRLRELAQRYLHYFAQERRAAMAEALQRLDRLADTPEADVVAAKGDVVRLIIDEIRPWVADTTWLAWPGMRHPALLDHVRLFLAMTPEAITDLAGTTELPAPLTRFMREFLSHEHQPTPAHAEALDARGAVTDAVVEWRALAASPQLPLPTRCHVLAQLIHGGARLQQWPDVELGLREMAQLVVTGHDLSPEAIAQVRGLLREYPEGDYRLPTTLHALLADTLAPSRLDRRLLQPWGEQISRIDRLLDGSIGPRPRRTIILDRWDALHDRAARRWLDWPPRRADSADSQPTIHILPPATDAPATYSHQ